MYKISLVIFVLYAQIAVIAHAADTLVYRYYQKVQSDLVANIVGNKLEVRERRIYEYLPITKGNQITPDGYGTTIHIAPIFIGNDGKRNKCELAKIKVESLYETKASWVKVETSYHRRKPGFWACRIFFRDVLPERFEITISYNYEFDDLPADVDYVSILDYPSVLESKREKTKKYTIVFKKIGHIVHVRSFENASILKDDKETLILGLESESKVFLSVEKTI